MSAYVAAHDCAVHAMSANTPFIVRWGNLLFDYGESQHAYTGVLTGGSYGITRFGAGTEGDSSTYSEMQTCTTVSDLGACGDVQETLCLGCSGMMKQVCP